MIDLLIWMSGVVVGNSIADITVATLLLRCNTTFYGIVFALFSPNKIIIPKPYCWLNSYFSFLLSWGIVAILIPVLFGILIYNKYNNGKSKRGRGIKFTTSDTIERK